MHTAIKQAKLNDKFQDPLYLFLELVRAGVMHGHLWTIGASSGGPSFGTGVSFLNERRYAIFSSVIAEEKSSMLLVMRVLSIVPLGFKVRCLLNYTSTGRLLTRLRLKHGQLRYRENC